MSLPVPLRRPAWIVVSLAVSVFVVLAVRYSGGSAAGRFDTRVTSILDADSSPESLKFLVTACGPVTVGAMTLALALLALALRRRRLALLAIVGPLLTGLVTTLVKPLAGRIIDGDSLSFPSGHTGAASSLGLVGALFLVDALCLGAPAAIATLMLGAFVPGGVMGIALVINGWHYPTDTIGGFCAAVSMVLGSALVIERIAERRPRTVTDEE